jgi:hypothetical protein
MAHRFQLSLYAAKMVRSSAGSSGKAVIVYGVASEARCDVLKAEPKEDDALLGYRELNFPERIPELSGGVGIYCGFDCISEGSSVE